MTPRLRMSMEFHMEGSLLMLRHSMHTFCAVSRISIVPSLWRIDTVTSLGRSSQFRHSSLEEEEEEAEEEGDFIFFHALSGGIGNVLITFRSENGIFLGFGIVLTVLETFFEMPIQMGGQNGQIPCFFEIFSNKVLFRK